jgi:rhodanese-related sulfurtransferase
MPTEIHRAEVRKLIEAGAQLIEVLAPAEYEREHLAGAINLPLKMLNRETTALLVRDRPVVVYCYDYE